MKIFKLSIILLTIYFISFFSLIELRAMEPGTLLYRTSSQGKIYGLNATDLIESSFGLVNKINSGHVGIYVGSENGIHYVVEALADGIVKTPASHFVNKSENEVFLGSKIPKDACPFQKAKAVAIAKGLARRELLYDFNFFEQKGPLSGQWTCVGLAEKIYESANALNPERLSALEYDKSRYAVDITRDGFDNNTIYNDRGDIFSTNYEFSKITKYYNSLLPAPEIFGYNAGREKNANRYIFLPYTQFLQDSLKTVETTINLETEFKSTTIRGKSPSIKIILNWSLINNPSSSIKRGISKLASWFSGPSREDAVMFSDIDDIKREVENEHILVSWLGENNDYNYQPIELSNLINSNQILNGDVEESIKEEKLPLLISMIGSSGTNDFVEIYNYGNIPIDLFENNIRLEKTVSASNPSILLRFDSESDASYPGSRIIEANSSYLIVREQASDELISLADAIGFRSNFSWTPSGYTLYLASGPVSSDDDERIIDKVGWGEANFYYGSSPAPAILENMVLRRKAQADTSLEDILNNGAHYNLAPSYNSYDNSFDFLLWPLTGELKEEDLNNEVIISSDKEEIIEEEEIIIEEDEVIIEEEIIEEDEVIIEEEEEEEVVDIKLLITQIGSDGFNDYLRIYNYGEEDIDLLAEEIRISKAYQSDNISIVLRFDNMADYSGKSIITANSSLLIVRDKADIELKNEADVIGLRSEFTWNTDGYTLYLSKGPVSNDDDIRIIDKVGWGKARFYYSIPALEIQENYFLQRKAMANSKVENMLEGGTHYDLAPIYNSHHNAFDFLLLPFNIIEEEIIEEEEEIIEEEEEIIEEEEEEEIEEELNLLITQIASDGFNDYLRIYNYGEEDIDLLAEEIRISKAYQSDNISVVLRFDQETDFTGKSIISANSSLLIVRDKADIELKNEADVIGLRSEFTWNTDGYTLYLSKGPVSNDDDIRIIDKVGWGDALYYYTLPSVAMEKNYILQRKAMPGSKAEDMLEGGSHYNLAPIYNSYNNAFDFLLLNLNSIEEEEIYIEEEKTHSLLISKISSDGFDDYLEIYNYGEEGINLFEENIRISKAYQSENISIVLRFDDENDYVGESIIPANSSLLIVRDKAELEILNEADVVGLRSEFTWTGSGYTLYISNGPVANDLDERIIDKVGWGEARFYQTNPASAIIENYALRRKPKEESKLSDIVLGGSHVNLAPIYNSNNNNNDFILWPKNNILPVNYLSALSYDYSPPGFTAFSDNISISVPALKHLWHFDECYGDFSLDEITRFSSSPLKIYGATPWYMDQFGCSRRMFWTDDDLLVNLPEKIDANDFAISLLFKTEEAGGRFSIKLSGEDPDRQLDVRFFGNKVEFNQGFPGFIGRIDAEYFQLGKEFNQLLLSFNNPSSSEQGYWTMEVNGQEKFGHLFSGLLSEFDTLEILGDNSELFIDELAIFDRGLSPSERQLLSQALPIQPKFPKGEQVEPKLKYAWLFDSAEGNIAKGDVGNQDIEIEGTSLSLNGYRGNALKITSYHEPFLLNLNEEIIAKDLSISFWWKSEGDGSLRLTLNDDLNNLFGLNLYSSGISYLFEKQAGSLASLENDNIWHHLALSYDSFNYNLSFYLNGKKVFEQKRKNFLPELESFSQLKIQALNGQAFIDELKIWQGALQEEQAMHEYSLIMD